MDKLIVSAIEEIKNNVPTIKTLSDDLLFGMVAYKFFYNNGKFDKSDYKTAYTDGAKDGGIDLIAVDEGEDDKSLVLIQSKNVKEVNSKDDIKDIFTKMAQTASDFERNKKSSYNERLRRIYANKYDEVKDGSSINIKLVLFLGFDKDDDVRDGWLNHLGKVDALADFEIEIYFEKELVQQIISFSEDKRFVPEGKIEIFQGDGAITNGDNGLLVNISAQSLREIFDRYKDEGLFEQNFRYFVLNKKIDNEIRKSLEKKRNKFWFLNNGIIIGCKSFKHDGNNVKLYDFSIVNGCQTTTLIGTFKGHNEDEDFPIPCKIVCPDKSIATDEEFSKFIQEIAEASNSQKPISDRDLKSNAPEQKKLQKELLNFDPQIYLEIKRGQGLPKKKGVESWQKVKNDQLGQLILSAMYQQPGTARSSKKKIFSDKATYRKVFINPNDTQTIVDLLELSYLWDKFESPDPFPEEPLSNVAKNGKYVILAIICFLIKYERGQIKLTIDADSDEWVEEITKVDLDGGILKPDRADNFEMPLHALFYEIVMTLTALYDGRQTQETSVSNFFKTDKKYHSVILGKFKADLSTDYRKNRLLEPLRLVFK